MLKHAPFLFCCCISAVTAQVESETQQPFAPIKYQPPQSNLPIRRIDAGDAEGTDTTKHRGLFRGWHRGVNRGLNRGLSIETDSGQSSASALLSSRLVTLAPQHTGMTSNRQPRLYWYVSGASSYPIHFNLNQQGLVEPIAQAILPPPEGEGIYTIVLADYGIYLQPDIEYEWFLTMILDEAERSSDFIAGATLQYYQLDDKQLARQTQLPPQQRPYYYAEQGLWYDAFDSLSQLIKQQPQSTALKKLRSDLLKQVGLLRAAGE
ncbi:hypothetical protein AB835_03785 [Candidatus Endobugula sertula]|uniref:DUF928 domain-containing protein n=1 Tax=Candidatus Endobugula sertula TaxID=62101 RepID=A0A1D2QS69_9GAMM|nr:hypothetical protein AB835_03785 [Candidatus Endobugula sertula]